MRYAWTEEQTLLRGALERLFAERFSFPDRSKQPNQYVAQAAWRELAQLGVLGLPFEEQFGGSEGGALDTALVMEALGRGLVPAPYIPSIVIGGGFLRYAGPSALKAELIPRLIAGDLHLALAFTEAQSRFNPANVATSAVRRGDRYILSGQKIVAYNAPIAGFLFVTARTGGAHTDLDGVSLFLVSVDAAGLEVRSYETADEYSAADIRLNGVEVAVGHLIGEEGKAIDLIERVLDEAIVAACAEAVGAMAALNARCVEHVRTRVAFGQTLSKFQALRHRIVDMHVAYEQAGALTLKAALSLSAAPAHRARIVSACKAQVCQEAAFVGKAAVQLHGAIGVTDELDVGRYFKRIMLFQHVFGGADYHLRRFLALSR
ncbi:MAG: acyl-CoA dehydrogenase family protein [Hyphomonadaceae bacterium]|nr:acyl-CoA dehydrogenase family protein [Hyphomonadaceae bacterium]